MRSRLYADSLRVIDEATELVRRTWDELDSLGLVHGDIMPGNTLWAGGRPYLIDFDGMACAPFAYDLAVALPASRGAPSGRAVGGVSGRLRLASRAPASLETHLDSLLAGRRVLVALWLAGNRDNPAFTQTPEWIK